MTTRRTGRPWRPSTLGRHLEADAIAEQRATFREYLEANVAFDKMIAAVAETSEFDDGDPADLRLGQAEAAVLAAEERLRRAYARAVPYIARLGKARSQRNGDGTDGPPT